MACDCPRASLVIEWIRNQDVDLSHTEENMTELNQADQELAMEQGQDSGGVSKWAGQDNGLVAGLLIAGGVLSALLLVLKKVRNIALWAGAVGMIGAGVALSLKGLQERERKIQETEQQILGMFGQLDPLARVQVAKHVAEVEFGKAGRPAP